MDMAQAWFKVLLLVTHSYLALTLIAYDCDDRSAELTTVSLRDIAPCRDPELSYASENVTVTVIQRNEVKFQHVWTCLIEITKSITHCGMHSHSSIVAGGLTEYVHQIGAKDCKLLHRYRTLNMFGQTIGQLTLNGTTTASGIIAGSLDTTGRCKGTTYQEHGRIYEDVVVTASYRIHAYDYMGTLNLEENELLMKGGVTCPFLEGYCFDTTIGEITWDVEPPQDCEELSMIYDGEATMLTERGTTFKYLVVEKGEKLFALTLLKQTTLCNIDVWQTEHPKLMISTNNRLKPTAQVDTKTTDLMAYINSKFLYIEQAHKLDVDHLYNDILYRRCMIQREILRNRLLMAPLLPDAISQIVQNQGGHIGRVLGEVLYIMRCIPKPVTIRRSSRCYNELPVAVNNQSKFVSPITRTIQDFAEEVQCNGLTPPLYYVDGQWIGLTPYPITKPAPRELEVEAVPKLHFSPIMPVGTQGLYTQQEVRQVQKLLTFGAERRAVENIIARRVAGLDTSSQGRSPLDMFDAEELEKLAQTTLKKVWGWFSEIGNFTSGLMGFYIVFRLIKYVIGVGINGMQLYRTAGRVHLLACLWNVLTMWVIHKHYQTKREPEEPEGDRYADLRAAAEAEAFATTSALLYPRIQLDTKSCTSLYQITPTAPHWTEYPPPGEEDQRI